MKKARQVYNEDNNNALSAYLTIERINCIERYLLNGLSNMNKNDHLGAFQFVSIYFLKK